ncbi:MAG: TonB-dependent receptor [Steroidobacteraceae bacterium]
MTDKTSRKRDMLLAAVSTWVVSSVALAQEGRAPGGALDEIVVTAQRRSENLQNVPIAVTAVSAESLAAAGVTNTQALQMVVPGLVINQVGGASGIYLRGVGTRVAFAGLEPSTATYQDDRYISGQTGSLFELMDVERVEVLRGPQGVLYGRNATSGAVRVITNDVSDEFEGYVSGAYGNYDDRELRGTINLPASETFGVRFAGTVHQRDGFVDNQFDGGRDDLNDRDMKMFRGKARWDITPAVTARLTVDHWRQRDASGLATVVLPPLEFARSIVTRGGHSGVDPDDAFTALTGDQKQTTTAGELRLDADLGFADLASISTYDRNNSNYPFDYDGTEAIDTDVLETNDRNRTYAQEIQLISRDSGAIEWLVGANYFYNKHYTLARIQVSPTTIISSGGDQSGKTKAYAAFGQVTWHATDELALIFGGRYTHESKDVSTVAEPGVVNLPGPFLPYSDSLKENKFNPKVVVQWTYAPDQMVYASYTQGFKSGGFNYPPTPPGAGEAPVPVLKPEILNSYEIGWKTELFDNRLRFNSTLFYYDYKDLQVSRTRVLLSGALTTQTDNAADAEVKGIEAEFTFRPAAAFTLSGTAAYIDGKYKNYSASAPCFRVDAVCNPTPTAATGLISVPFDADDHRMLRLPKFSGHLSATYDPGLGEGRLPISVTYAYKSNYYFDFVAGPFSEELKQSGYGLFSANIAYFAPSDRYRISIYGNNLFDKEYTNLRQSTGPAIIGTYGDPRTYGVRAEVNF